MQQMNRGCLLRAPVGAPSPDQRPEGSMALEKEGMAEALEKTSLAGLAHRLVYPRPHCNRDESS